MPGADAVVRLYAGRWHGWPEALLRRQRAITPYLTMGAGDDGEVIKEVKLPAVAYLVSFEWSVGSVRGAVEFPLLSTAWLIACSHRILRP